MAATSWALEDVQEVETGDVPSEEQLTSKSQLQSQNSAEVQKSQSQLSQYSSCAASSEPAERVSEAALADDTAWQVSRSSKRKSKNGKASRTGAVDQSKSKTQAAERGSAASEVSPSRLLPGRPAQPRQESRETAANASPGTSTTHSDVATSSRTPPRVKDSTSYVMDPRSWPSLSDRPNRKSHDAERLIGRPSDQAEEPLRKDAALSTGRDRAVKSHERSNRSRGSTTERLSPEVGQSARPDSSAASFPDNEDDSEILGALLGVGLLDLPLRPTSTTPSARSGRPQPATLQKPRPARFQPTARVLEDLSSIFSGMRNLLSKSLVTYSMHGGHPDPD